MYPTNTVQIILGMDRPNNVHKPTFSLWLPLCVQPLACLVKEWTRQPNSRSSQPCRWDRHKQINTNPKQWSLPHRGDPAAAEAITCLAEQSKFWWKYLRGFLVEDKCFKGRHLQVYAKSCVKVSLLYLRGVWLGFYWNNLDLYRVI